jgi:hypothetical protein
MGESRVALDGNLAFLGGMMKLYRLFVIVTLLIGLSLPAHALLIDRGTGMIYDTELGITWLQDANYARTSGYDDDGLMNWFDATDWAANLEYGGLSNWRLPFTPATTIDSIGYFNEGEMAHLYYDEGISYSAPGPFVNIGTEDSFTNQQYWTQSHFINYPNTVWDFQFGTGRQGATVESSPINLSWAVHDGDFGPSVSTTQSYLTDYLVLGDTFSFDYWWEMVMEPTEPNLDVLFFNGTEWETLGWELNFGGSSNQWETASFWVPEWSRGTEAQIMFRAFDFGQVTDPTVYLRNIGSNTAPVPEPSTMILLGTGLVGLIGFSRKKNRK